MTTVLGNKKDKCIFSLVINYDDLDDDKGENERENIKTMMMTERSKEVRRREW